MCSFQKILQTLLVVLTMLLSACGGGGSAGTDGGGTTAGIGGTGRIASGTITGFGSIFLNGTEYFGINTANCVIDDRDRTGNCQQNLELGMVVQVTGTVDGTTGTATQVIFDDDVDGPVGGISAVNPGDVTRTFTVLNTSVQIDSASTKFAGALGRDFNSLRDGDVVEVSGFFDSAGVLQATYIESKELVDFGTTQVEVKGIVSSTVPANGAGSTGDTFVVNDVNGINDMTITIAASADLSDMPGGVVSNGDLVEVRGILTAATEINANRVELEDDSIGDDGDEVSIEGLITNFNSQSDFRVDGQLVNASTATLDPSNLQLGNGIKVEVEGTISGTTLIAEEVEARGDDVKIQATVSTVSANSVTLQFWNNTLTVQIDSQTQMEDKTGAVSNMTLSDINATDFLEISGFVGAGGAIVASELRRESAANADDDILQGPVGPPGSWDENAGTVTLLGVTFFSDGGTSFEDETETSIGSAAFYGALSVGRSIKIRDDIPQDGFADEMDLED